MHLETLSLSLAALMVVVGVLITTRMRLSSLVSLFRLQAIFLALFALVHALEPVNGELIAVAVLIFALKALVIPTFLMRSGKTSVGGERLQSYLRPTSSLLLSLAAIVGAGFAAHTLADTGIAFLLASASFALVFFGLILLITRRDMYGQGVGFLVMENGIYTFGLALTGGMPFFVEIGVLFDLMILFVLFVALLRRAHVEHASAGTDKLQELTD